MMTRDELSQKLDELLLEIDALCASRRILLEDEVEDENIEEDDLQSIWKTQHH
jgi:hypothetical protein